MNILVKSYGCSANFSDGEAIKGMLQAADFKIVDESEEEAAVVILNICTVKEDETALKEIKETIEKRKYAHILVAGCVPSGLIPKIREMKSGITIINTHNIREIVSAVEETINDNPQTILEPKRKPKILLNKIRDNPLIGIVPISNGCLGKCAYCSVKLIKGKLYSYPPDLIIKEVERCVKEGCKEIWITAQDTAAYGKDSSGNGNIAELLQKIVAVNGEFMVKLGTGNPNHIKENLDGLITVLKNPKMYKFIHIPVQSGSNKILKAMIRPYTAEDFREIAARLRKEIPEITIATDVIVGFPGETTEQFYETVKLIQGLKTSVANISKFAARPDTAAANMKDQVESEEIQDRSGKMTTAVEFAAFDANKQWKGWQGEIFIYEKGKEGAMIGRNYAYKPVVVFEECKLGGRIKVKINGFVKNCLRGEKVI